MEGRVFQCSWRRVAGGYRVWVARLPGLAASGSSFSLADQALAGVICEATGDGESVHEYDPPRPDSPDLEGVVDRLATVSGNHYARIANGEALFQGGLCSVCRRGIGERTDVPLVLSDVESGTDGGAATLGPRVWEGPCPLFFSETFLDRLGPEERASCEWRQVERKGRARKRFFELVGARFRVFPVALSDVVATLWHVDTEDVRSGSVIRSCSECGFVHEPAYTRLFPRGYPMWYVNAPDLGDPAPAVLAVGNSQEYHFCLTRERWRHLARGSGTAGLSSLDIGVVVPSLVDSSPPVEVTEDGEA